MPLRIVSGGQTGADRGGLDAAIALGLEHGGWCPRGRLAEDGTIPARYQLNETDSEDLAVRTERNVRDSDATVVFTYGAPKGGSGLTIRLARHLGRPRLHVDLDKLDEKAAATKLATWLEKHAPNVLNVAGSRESKAPGIQEVVKRVLVRALSVTRHEQGELLP